MRLHSKASLFSIKPEGFRDAFCAMEGVVSAFHPSDEALHEGDSGGRDSRF
jgi:hypothetical protein